MAWVFRGSCLDGQPFALAGQNVWARPWEGIDRTAAVIDPLYHVTKHFGVYRLRGATPPVEFAAGEFSNGVWGFYQEEP